MSRKALFFDIDGTLLTEGSKTLPSSAVKAIEAARKAGHLVFINSGRARCLMREIEDGLSVDGFLCGCGTYIEIQGRAALHHLIGKARRMELQRCILSHNLEGVLEGTGNCFMHTGKSRMEEMERLKKVFFQNDILHYADWNKEVPSFDKFCVLADQYSDVNGFLKELGSDMAPIDRGHGLYECVPAGFDKAAAMKFTLDYFHIPWEESYAFGDSTNDLAMIRYACNSVIMGKHDRELEPYASFITKNVEDDGIAYALEALRII